MCVCLLSVVEFSLFPCTDLKEEKGKWMEALVPGSCHPEDREDVPLPTPEVVSSAPPLTTPAVQHGVVNPPPYPEAQFYPQLPTNYH